MKLFGSNKHLAAQNRLAALDIVLKHNLIRESLEDAQKRADKLLSWAYNHK